jgi:hypothetical protein
MNKSKESSSRKPILNRETFDNYIIPNIKRLIIIVSIGLLAGTQIAKPNKRVIEAVLGFAVIFIFWNFSSFAALSFVILLYPFPVGMSFGNSNLVLTILIFIIYLIRVSSGMAKIRSEKMLNVPIILLVSSYILSYINYEYTPFSFTMAYIHTINFFAAIIYFYLIVNFVNTEERLKKVVRLMTWTALLAITFTLFEVYKPGGTIIPGWLYTIHKTSIAPKDVRMGGPFLDFELFAEFCALNVPILLFMLLRARRHVEKYFYAIILLADIFMLFTTMTRGAFISLSIGLFYLAILSRRDLNFVRASVILIILVVLVFGLEGIVAKYTVSGSLFNRLAKTTFAYGIIPDTRSRAWFMAWDRAMEHPILGHGPGWDFTSGLERETFPHSCYLYILNITGFFGLIAFLFLLYRLIRATLPGIKSSLLSSPFPEALMKVLHVCLVMFIIDQIKIEYLRNLVYVFFTWLFFGVIMATWNVILKNKEKETASTAPG